MPARIAELVKNGQVTADTADTNTADTVEPSQAETVAAEGEATDDGFRQFGLSAPVLRALDELGFEAPTPVQQATIRLLMEGRVVIAQAQTGTGKTAAYGIPLVERIDPALDGAGQVPTQGLVLTPTRELAIQVAEAL